MAGIIAIVNTNQAPVGEMLLRAIADVPGNPGSSAANVRVESNVGLGVVPFCPATAAHYGSASVARGADEQPLTLDGQVWTVMDGRLDDRRALEALLEGESRGHLDAEPDAALLARAYAKWGDACVSHLLGDFAFCIWDSRRRRLVCGRDHFGVKPLYVAHVGGALVVSSVLRWVRRHPAVSHRLRDEAVGDFLLFGLCMDPSQTAFADISRVPPAHRLVYCAQTNSTRVERYWELTAGETAREADPQEYLEQFSSLLRSAVADRLTERTTAVLMSGGLDSSSVATVAADVIGPAAPSRLRAFTIVYDTLMADDERQHSSDVAASIGIPICHFAADQYRPFERWGSGLAPPEPSLEALTAVMADLLHLLSQQSHVALTGDGGDPMLLPSSVIDHVGHVSAAALAIDLWRAWRAHTRPPFGIRSRLSRWFASAGVQPAWLSRELTGVFDARTRQQDVAARRAARGGARRAALSDVSDPWWPSTFESLDPGATGCAVELRYPFFDVRLASFLLRLPSFPWCVDKHILRSAMKGRLPESVRTRSKTPLAGSPIAPGDQWSVRQALALFDATPEIARFVDVDTFRTTVQGTSLLSNASLGAWAAISLAVWLRCDSGAAVQ
jgi:asparagine synthase (glutamine-hydrolysing)